MIKNYPLYKVVFPSRNRIDSAVDCIPLYIQSEISKVNFYANCIKSRNQISLPKNTKTSFCSYFNAFPASYWQRNTSLKQVILVAQIQGKADIYVKKSDEFGNQEIVGQFDNFSGKLEHKISLNSFANGGWIWFEIVAKDSVVLKNAFWGGDVPKGFGADSATIGITTLNKQQYCLEQLENMAEHLDELTRIDKIYFVDQGSDNLSEYKGVSQILDKFNKRVKIIKQKNYGGSGGFSRSMYETIKDNKSDYVILLDDDTFLETQCLERVMNFASLCNNPTIVGGHMLTMNDPPRLHAFAEGVRRDIYKWGPLPGTFGAYNLSDPQKFLVNSEWLHKCYEVDYNGWWMCLIPTNIIREIGLATPMFIKWDDSEFGLRASDAGYKTVSLPGAAVWHEAWVGKDDTVDWTAFYHWRNRFIVALFYMEQNKAIRFLLDTYIWAITMAASMRYSLVFQYISAMEFLYNNPEEFIADLEGRKEKIDQMRSQYTDGQLKDFSDFPRPRYKTNNSEFVGGSITKIASLFFGLLKQFAADKPLVDGRSDYFITQGKAYWWRLPNIDSALVASNVSGKVALLKRDRKMFFSLVTKLTKLHLAIFKDWNNLHEKFVNARYTMSSIETWQKLFEKNSDQAKKRTKK
ncbi:MAG: glycosyltransferase [Bifidobacteriaceae bacterium]|jgi:galactofuranosylgalactofuranosylrhamnosyl-N-acetylglucosaminyl-diphospho-decaprenol beta-1,5/1,6-galactofuranosyltransferase|nr:glycosyltransferase [Bifidobacteriaceae bacterium]